jgi:DNA-binding SARP family transcriptional activator/tetratricopeptide (TPR) repeat protein
MVDFRLLGPVEVWAGPRRLDAGQPRQRTVLAALLADAGRVVGTATLVDRVWGDDPPPTARQSLASHLARVRGVLAEAARAGGTPVRLVHRSGGYLLSIEPEQVDLFRFRRLLAAAREPQQPGEQHAPQQRAAEQRPPEQRPPERRVALLREAVALWRGEPLTGLTGAWAQRMRESWALERLDAMVEWARAELALGDTAAVLGPLSELIAEHPLAEPLAEVLMRALAAAGRPAEALAVFVTARQRLADELGTEPGGELRAVHRSILRGELAAPVPAASAPPPVRPAQLPADVPAFAGRVDQLARLDGLLPAGAGSPVTVTVSALSGTAGVGKTALAVHWAHRVAGRFPDGQLYVNLRGFDHGGAPVAPADALRGFLDAFGTPPQRIPAGLTELSTLYRSVLAGKRVLVVLDNARDAEQVRPLLPGAPGCLALVTSRTQLTGLIAAEGAHPLGLDVLPVAEARELLARRVGADRVAADPGAVGQIISACARLPLALSIAAARAQQSGFPLAETAAELRTAGRRLDALDAGDAATQVRTVFSWSYATLTPTAARLFRLLGTHWGPDLDVAAAASLAGLPPAGVRPPLAELTRAHLVAEHAPGRFALHDLLRVYAAELAGEVDGDGERRAALHRTFDHYLHTAYAADRLIHPERDPIMLPDPVPGVTPEPLRSAAAALSWVGAELTVLLRSVGRAAADGFDAHAWRLTWALTDTLQRLGHWHEQVEIQHAALAAGRRLADRAVQVQVHRSLARGYLYLGREHDALAQARQALDLVHGLADPAGHATVHLTLSKVLERMGRNRESLDQARRALAIFSATGNRHGEANSLNSVGWQYNMLQEGEKALRYCQQSLTLHQELGNRIGAALTRDSVGYIRHHLGRYAAAVDDYRQAIALLRELGDRYNEAVSTGHLGDALAALGDLDTARDCWRQALQMLDELGHPDAEKLRDRLRAQPEREAVTTSRAGNSCPNG